MRSPRSGGASPSLDLVDPPQIRVDPRLPAGTRGLVGFDHLSGQPQRHQFLGRRLVWATSPADRGGKLRKYFGERFCLGEVFLGPLGIVADFPQVARAIALLFSV